MHDAQDTNALSVVIQQASAGRATEIMGELGRIEGEHAWLDIAQLKSLGPVPRSCSWDERFAQAMGYAKDHGWTDPSGKFVRAHVEPAAS
ncbi:hypothetical protein [uncultured Jatrophihabitans sp.]|uniref:hypothetical protein n=1 Tax=uncultured Jatrophihabitans sp. TaxID=1610747 RepID=UPI0035CBB85B